MSIMSIKSIKSFILLKINLKLNIITLAGRKVKRTEKKSKPKELEVMFAPLRGPRILTVLTFSSLLN